VFPKTLVEATRLASG